MISARTADSKVWKTCIGAMVNLIDEAAFKFTPTGIKMRAMDPSHIALVDFELPAGAFVEYNVERPEVMGVKLAEMNKIIARAKAEDELAIQLDEGRNRMVLTFKGASTRRFSLPLRDVRGGELPEPELKFTARAEVTAGIIQDGLRDAEIIGDSVRVVLDGDGLSMSTESDAGATELRLRKGDPGLMKLQAEQPARAMYSIKYLMDMTRAASPGDAMAISLGTDLPIQLDFPIAEGKGRLRFLLAPRIEASGI